MIAVRCTTASHPAKAFARPSPAVTSARTTRRPSRGATRRVPRATSTTSCPAPQQCARGVAADEPGSTGDGDAHLLGPPVTLFAEGTKWLRGGDQPPVPFSARSAAAWSSRASYSPLKVRSTSWPTRFTLSTRPSPAPASVGGLLSASRAPPQARGCLPRGRCPAMHPETVVASASCRSRCSWSVIDSTSSHWLLPLHYAAGVRVSSLVGGQPARTRAPAPSRWAAGRGRARGCDARGGGTPADHARKAEQAEVGVHVDDGAAVVVRAEAIAHHEVDEPVALTHLDDVTVDGDVILPCSRRAGMRAPTLVRRQLGTGWRPARSQCAAAALVIACPDAPGAPTIVS